MTELVVVSGKGGTGKTTVTGALAGLLPERVLVDCDVDAANLRLILDHNVIETQDFIGGQRSVIDAEACIPCGTCYDLCRFDAVVPFSDPKTNGIAGYRIDPYACEGCGVCGRFCPEEAIHTEPVMSGQWFVSDSNLGPLVHARLGIAAGNSGRLVSLLRQEARRRAETLGLDYILIDGPPGIGCPVIASITGATYVLIVTEPSLSALHDMSRLLEVVRHFGIPAGVCINKHDIHEIMTRRIEQFAAEQQLPVLGRLRYDRAVVAAQLKGQTVLNNISRTMSGELSGLQTALAESMKSAGGGQSLRTRKLS
ncbi:MAG: ATP-binding protein [candidate division Zixibacteria bacterium]|nr:ATP-binding protein [candidate division Zixibacteria bacterium]